MTAVGNPQRGGWGHGGYWECSDENKCFQARGKTHMENRG